MGEWGVRACLALNHLFPRRPHPFNLALAGDMRYTEWQFQQAEEVLRRYQRLLSTSASASSADTWCRGRRLLDLGCGAGGKSVFFALQGAEVVGVDLAADLCRQGEGLAATRGVSARCRFQVGDAAALPFSTASFDIVLASDVIEHLAQVEAAVAECWRVLRPGGLLLVDFSPYMHPFGAHLWDAISIPWAHLLFAEDTLVEAYRRLVQDLPDGPRRLRWRLGEDGRSLTYLNRMSIARWEAVLAGSRFHLVAQQYVPLHRVLRPLAGRLARRGGKGREALIKHAVYVCRKDGIDRDGGE